MTAAAYTAVTGAEDQLCVRDIRARVRALESDYEDLIQGFRDQEELRGTLDFDAEAWAGARERLCGYDGGVWLEANAYDLDDLGGDACDDYDELQSLREVLEDVSHDDVLVRDSAFTDYIKALCVDIGDIPEGLPEYISNHIDWDGVADELLADYAETSVRGQTYYYRA